MGERTKAKTASKAKKDEDHGIHPERLLARDVMVKRLLVLRAEESVEGAARLLEEHHVGGAPVVDASGTPLGVFTATDVTRAFGTERRGGRGGFVDGVAGEDEDDLLEEGISLREGYSDELVGGDRVGDWMTPSIVSVSPAATIGEVCRVMLRESIHRVFVQEERKLVGVVSTSDLVALLAGAGSPEGPPRLG